MFKNKNVLQQQNVRVAQLVEHSPEERRVTGSTPVSDTEINQIKKGLYILFHLGFDLTK